jgi:hypothetical protein
MPRATLRYEDADLRISGSYFVARCFGMQGHYGDAEHHVREAESLSSTLPEAAEHREEYELKIVVSPVCPRGKSGVSEKSLDCWRPRRDLNPCYRRESGMAKRNSNKLQEHGRTGWRSRSSKKHLIVSPMCPRTF